MNLNEELKMAELEKIRAETARITMEAEQLRATTLKLQAEADKIQKETKYYPTLSIVLALIALVASLIALFK